MLRIDKPRSFRRMLVTIISESLDQGTRTVANAGKRYLDLTLHGCSTFLEKNQWEVTAVYYYKANSMCKILPADQYSELREVAPQVDWRFELALVLGRGTWHRINAIRLFSWSRQTESLGSQARLRVLESPFQWAWEDLTLQPTAHFIRAALRSPIGN